MLSLKIDDTNVDLPEDFSFTMNLKSPMFGDIGSYSYPFKLPNSPRNATLLGFRHWVENTGDVYETNQGMFLWNGLNLFQGTVKLKTLNSGSYEGSIFEGEGDFFYLRKTLSLQQIDFGELTFADENARLVYINNCSEKEYPERNVAFPSIFDELYFDPPTEDNARKWINNYEEAIIHSSTGLNRSIIIPMLYLRFVLDKIFTKLEYTLDDLFFTENPDFNKCLIYNSVDCNEGESGYFTYPLTKLIFNYHAPTMSINDFFLGLETFFNIRFFINNKTKIVKIASLDDVIKSIEYNDVKKVISIVTEVEDQISGFKLEMDLDSDDTSTNDLKNSDETNISSVKSNVLRLADLPAWPSAVENDIRYVINNKCFYRMISKVWTLFDINDMITYTKYLYKAPEAESLSTKTSPLLERLMVPGEFVQVANKQINWRAISLRLFFLTTYYEEGYFYSMNGNSYTDDTSLCYNGSTGLFEKQFKAFCDFRMSAKFVKITAQLDFKDLRDFDFSRKIMVNGTKYLVKSLQVNIKKDRIMPALLECYTCN